MIYIRDNGAYYERSVDYIRSDKPEALVLDLLMIEDDRSAATGPTVLAMSETGMRVMGALEIVALDAWWHKVRMRGQIYGDPSSRVHRANMAAQALGLEGRLEIGE